MMMFMVDRRLLVVFLVAAACACSWGCEKKQPVEGRAMAAYRAGDYEKALPLLKEWAAEVQSNREQFAKVMGYILEAEKKTGRTRDPLVEASTTSTNGSTAATQATTGTAMAATMGGAPVDPNTGKPRVLHKPVKPGDVRAMTIKQLGNFEFDPLKDADVPEDVHLLEGAKVRLRGFIVPWNQAEKITDFALVPSLTSCCFGQPPGPQHVITCRFPKGKSMNYTVDEIYAEGILKVNVKREDGYSYSVFELDVMSVKYAD